MTYHSLQKRNTALDVYDVLLSLLFHSVLFTGWAIRAENTRFSGPVPENQHVLMPGYLADLPGRSSTL